MDDIVFRKVDKNNEEELAKYEEELYRAFSKNDSNGWAMNNYLKINNCRLRSKLLSIYDQDFYIAINRNNSILLGATINYNKQKLQYKQMGFKFDNHESDQYCEGTIFFSNENEIKNYDFIKVATTFFNFIEQDIKMQDIYIVYGTCSRKLKAMYSLLGYEKIEKINIGDITKLLMRMKLNE